MNTSQTPPGGWQFVQPQTGWAMPTPVGLTHDQAVNMLIKHRLANTAAVQKYRLATDFDTVSRELIKFQQIRGALPPDPIPKLTPPPVTAPRLVGAVSDAVAAVKKLAAGGTALYEWEELGYPHVEPEVAAERAAICVTCPKNQQGRSLTEYFTVPVAEMYNKRFQKLQELKLSTPDDDKLAVCQGCLCPLRTKVWFLPELIKKRLTPEIRAELNQIQPRCWQLSL